MSFQHRETTKISIFLVAMVTQIWKYVAWMLISLHIKFIYIYIFVNFDLNFSNKSLHILMSLQIVIFHRLSHILQIVIIQNWLSQTSLIDTENF